jgi:hypothetical protein
MKKVLAALVVLGLTSFAFAAGDTNATEKKAEKKVCKSCKDHNKTHKAKKACKAKEEVNATK